VVRCSNSISDESPTDGRFGLTRRRLLVAGGGVAALAGGGGLYVTRALDGDFGDETAPDDHPTITTRGRVDPETSDAVAVTPTVEGSWDDSDELFVFVHGFDTDDPTARDQAYTTQLGLDELRPAPVAAYSWDSDVDWEPAKALADANAQVLADWLGEWDSEDGRAVHLIGYSLGARVCLETLRVLTDDSQQEVVESVSLLGGAVPHDSVETGGRYGEAIAAVDAPVSNFHSSNDRVLSWVYRLSDRTRAVGQQGIADPEATPDGYTDVDVTDSVDDHFSYFQPDEGCLPQLVDQLP